jgi:L-alanine-DL-glutamate epimerase-like enolase superfamily enzyme
LVHTCRIRRWWSTDVGENPLQNEIFVEPLRYADGHLDVPQGPGLGVTLDEAAVYRFTPA